MPRELLLPIPHELADKVHHALTASAEAYADDYLRHNDETHKHTSLQFHALAEKLDTLARESGVLGW
jgi:protein tyrosine/serine phosphatase